MISKESMMKIRKDVENYIGESIEIKSNVGRNKIVNQRGVIDSAYTNLFVVKDPESCRKMSFSYADVAMNALEITKIDGGEQIIKYGLNAPRVV